MEWSSEFFQVQDPRYWGERSEFFQVSGRLYRVTAYMGEERARNFFKSQGRGIYLYLWEKAIYDVSRFQAPEPQPTHGVELGIFPSPRASTL